MAKTIKDIREYLHTRDTEVFDCPPIEEVVKSHVAFSSYSASDWNSVYCAVCGDGSRKQGPRGGWKFDGDNCRYNCFNCGISGAFTPDNDITMSNNMKIIFESFGIPKREYGRILFKHKLANNVGGLPDKPKVKKDRIEDLIGDGMPFPDYLISLEDAKNSNVGKRAIQFLEEEKCINYKDYPFFVSYGKTDSKKQQDKINAKIMVNRLIIPIYYNNKLLLLQGRNLEENGKKKYINIGDVSKTVYGLDRLKPDHNFVFVNEGFFDAYHLDGVAIITNKLTGPQVKMLNLVDKDKIVVPDRNETINTMLVKGVENEGWGFTAPRELQNSKDVTNSILKYGKLYTIYTLMKNIKQGDEARFLLNAWKTK